MKLSDGPQSLYPEQFGNLTRDLYVIAPVVGKQMDFDYLKKAEVMTPCVNGGKNTAAFTGENGSYSHKASLSYFGDEVTSVPMKRYRDIFNAVESGSVAYGVIPVKAAASAVRAVKASDDSGIAAIGSAMAADIFDLQNLDYLFHGK